MEVALANEGRLIERAKADPAQFAAVYDHYYSRVYTFVRYRVVDPATADDLTSDIFTTAFSRLSSYRPDRAPFAAWLFGIARNTVNSHFRRARYRRWLGLDAAGEQPDRSPQPDEAAARREQAHDLLQAVGRLSDREQEVLALKFAGGLTNRTIAELTGLSESNVGVTVYRAIRRLRADLNEENES